jgi:hypothetical protein
MPGYHYSFMMEWGSWICGMGMILFGILCLVMGLILLKKLYPHFRKEFDDKNNIDKP